MGGYEHHGMEKCRRNESVVNGMGGMKRWRWGGVVWSFPVCCWVHMRVGMHSRINDIDSHAYRQSNKNDQTKVIIKTLIIRFHELFYESKWNRVGSKSHTAVPESTLHDR